MSLAHVSIGKVLCVAANVIIVAVVAMDPTVKVAIIAGVALVLANIPTLIVGLLNRQAVKEMSINVDGNLRRLLDDKVTASAAHAVTSNELAREVGHREGSDEERARDKT
jgi:hypothetical protein